MVETFGKEQCEKEFSCLLSTLRRPPSCTTVRVNTLQCHPREAKDKLMDYLNSNQPGKGFKILEISDIPDALVITSTMSFKEVLPFHKVVIVDRRCGSSVLRGSHVYAPGIVAAHPGMKSGEMVSVYADIDGKCLRGLVKPYMGQKVFVGNGVAAIGRKELFKFQTRSGLAVEMTETLQPCPSLGSALSQFIFLQNLPSLVCSRVLNPQPGELVLDMCAAPGGKTTHLATLMRNEGRVVAFDKTSPKVQKIKDNAHRLGLNTIEAYLFDGTKAIAPHGFESDPKLPPYPPNTFDRIMLDVPCSALGQRPQLGNTMTVEQLCSYPPLQRKLFDAAVQLLKPGGTLVYSTCTLTLAENEDIVHWAIKTYPSLVLDVQRPYLGKPGLVGCKLKDSERQLVQRFASFAVDDDLVQSWNSVVGDTIGFFIAKFVKLK